MKKSLLITCIMVIFNCNCFAARTFSKTNSLGQTIYYQIRSSAEQTLYVIKHASYSQSLSGTVEIPSSVSYEGTSYSVSSIGVNAFNGCTEVTEFVLPNSITDINANAFSGCTGLTSIVLPRYLKKLSGFSNCTNLQYVSMPDRLVSITGNAFENCQSLRYLEIPASVRRIDGSAFAGTGISSFNVAPNSTYYRVLIDKGLVSYNGDTLIAYPPALNSSSFNLTGSYHIIGNGAFYHNRTLQKIVLGENIEQISASAFEGCQNLKSVLIGENIYSIEDKVFMDCTSLDTLIMKPKTPPQIQSNSFTRVPKSCHIFVPCAALNAYHSNSTFISFSNLEGLFDYDIKIGVNDETRGYVKTLTKPSCEYPELLLEAIPYAGYRFIKWSDNCPDAMRSIDVENDINLTAFFSTQSSGIDCNEGYNVAIYCSKGHIFITIPQPRKILIFDIQGHIIFEGYEQNVSLPVRKGSYIVHIDGMKQKKIVVV